MKIHLKIQSLFLPLGFSLLTACSSGGDGGSLSGDAGNPANPTEKLLQDLNNPISSGACNIPFVFVDDWGEELMNRIRSGDAACTKKVIEVSKLDVNIPQKVFAQDKKVYPIWHSLTTSSLFFANGTADKAFQVVKVLVEAGARLDTKNDSNQSPLQYAVENDEVFRRYPVVSAYLILSGKSNLLETNKLGLAPYHYVIQRGSLEHLQLMLDKNIDINFPTNNGKAPLLIAFEANFLTGIELLLARGVRVDFKDQNGNSSLQRAIHQNYDAVALQLIDKGLDLNLANNSQETALFSALQSKKIEILQKLLSKNVNVDLRTSQTTPLHLALSQGLSAIVDSLLERVQTRSEVDSDGNTVMHLLVLQGAFPQLQRALQKQFVVDQSNKTGATALHLATEKDDLSMVQALIAAGASVKTADLQKKLPIHKVKSSGILELLIQNKSPVNDLDSKGNSPLAYVALSQKKDLVSLLIQNQANAQWVDSSGRSLVSHMISLNNLDLAQFFIDRGVHPASEDSFGNTALFYAGSVNAIEFIAPHVNINSINSEKQSALIKMVRDYTSTQQQSTLDMIQRMIELKADINVPMPGGKGTLLHFVMKERQLLIAPSNPSSQFLALSELLLKNDIKLNAKDKDGNTALHYADTVEEIELLGKYNAIANVANKQGMTAKESYTPEKKKLVQKIKVADEELALLEADLAKAKANSETQKINQLMAEIKKSTFELEALKSRSSEIDKLVAAIESIGG